MPGAGGFCKNKKGTTIVVPFYLVEMIGIEPTTS